MMAELTTAVSLALLVLIGGALSFVDVREHRLPDKLTATLGVLTLVVALARSVAVHSAVPVLQTVVGVAVVFALMAVLVVAGSGIGGGDVKFAAVAAGPVALVGGVSAALGGLALGLVLVGVVAVFARRSGHSFIPYGPGLWLGALTLGLIGALVN